MIHITRPYHCHLQCFMFPKGVRGLLQMHFNILSLLWVVPCFFITAFHWFLSLKTRFILKLYADVCGAFMDHNHEHREFTVHQNH
jgi:hypothetical protein